MAETRKRKKTDARLTSRKAAGHRLSMAEENRQPGNPGHQLRLYHWLLSGFFWLAVWFLVWRRVDQEILLASPQQVLLRLLELFTTAAFWWTAATSLIRIMLGYLLGVAAGLVLAVCTVRLKWIHALFYPLISAIRATPVSSFIILALVWMTSYRVVVFIVFLMVLPIIWANVAEGLRKTDRLLLEMADVFRLRPRQFIRAIYVPSVAPFFITAAMTALGLGWKAGIAAEVLSTPAFSLGGRLYESKIYLETIDLMALTIFVILLSLLLEKVLLRLLTVAERYFRRHGQGRRGL